MTVDGVRFPDTVDCQSLARGGLQRMTQPRSPTIPGGSCGFDPASRANRLVAGSGEERTQRPTRLVEGHEHGAAASMRVKAQRRESLSCAGRLT